MKGNVVSNCGLRHLLPVLGAMLLAAGCATDDGSDSRSTKQRAQDDPNAKALARAHDEFEKDPDDLNLCRNLSMAYIAKASMSAAAEVEGKAPKPPKDRDKSLRSAVKTLDRCSDLDSEDVNTKQMLASTYMALSQYRKASPLLEELATSKRNDANAYYSWGLAASNAQQDKDLIFAWQRFLQYADAGDPRIKYVTASIKSLKKPDAAPVENEQ